MSLGDNIKKIRTSKNVTQRELAEKLSVSTRTIQNYESGNRTPNIEALRKIAEALEIDISYLLFNKKESQEIEEISNYYNELYEENKNMISAQHKVEIANIKINSFLNFTKCIGIEDFRELPRENILNIIDSKFLFDALMKLLELERVKALLTAKKKYEESTNKPNKTKSEEVETIAAHLDDKNVTPEKMEEIKDYIDSLFDDEE